MGVDVYSSVISHSGQPNMTIPLQAVTFDLWQTLMHDSKEEAQRRGQRRVERIHQALAGDGLAITREDVQEACSAIWKTWQERYWDRDVDPGFDAQIDFLRERLHLPTDADGLLDQVKAGYVEPIFEFPPTVDGEALEAMAELDAAGLRLGLICNTSVTPGAALRRLLAGWGLDRYLKMMLFSDELGARKPAVSVFHEASRRLGVEPPALLHIGDRADADVQGAVDAGAQGLLVDANTSLRKLVARLTSSPA
jgi:putative hydrolase of the HAD superfamily